MKANKQHKLHKQHSLNNDKLSMSDKCSVVSLEDMKRQLKNASN